MGSSIASPQGVGWKSATPTAVVWRLAKWRRGGARLHATAGGSAAEIPPDFTISFDPEEPEPSSEQTKPAK